MSDTVIKIEDLYKEYQLGVIGHGTLYRDLQSWWAKLRGKEDPNSLIGSTRNARVNDHILALKNINLEIKDGEVLGIIGANGAGKSTLLKILSRVTAPTSGVMKVKGRIASLLEVGTGFHPELTGRENIYLNGAINGMNKMEVSKRLDEIVDFSGVEKFLDTPVKRYSSGMYVRLGFAVAAHLDADILVVDEVLAVGDASFQKKAIGKMQDVSKGEGRSVLFVSHNMASVSSLCDRAILLFKGGLVKDGVTSEVIQYYLDYAVQQQPVINKKNINKLKDERSFGGNKLFEIHEVSITDKDGVPKLDYISTEEINVKISFKCLKEVMNFRLGVYVNMTMGIHIMSSLFSDDESLVHHTNLKPGEYNWVCKIPPNIFGRNQFYISINMIEHSVYHLRLNNVFKINVKFVGYNNVTNVVNAPSPFKPKFKWVKMQ